MLFRSSMILLRIDHFVTEQLCFRHTMGSATKYTRITIKNKPGLRQYLMGREPDGGYRTAQCVERDGLFPPYHFRFVVHGVGWDSTTKRTLRVWGFYRPFEKEEST